VHKLVAARITKKNIEFIRFIAGSGI